MILTLTSNLHQITMVMEQNLKELGPNLIPADINEYTTSKADLVIRNEKLILNDRLKCV